MSSRLIKIILIYLTIIMIGGAIPCFIFKVNRLQASLDVIRTLAILATSLIALLYFDPFGIKKKKIERQYENVTNILEKFIGQRLILSFTNGDMVGFRQLFINREFIFSEHLKHTDDISSLPVFFQLNNIIDSQAELMKLKNHLWTAVEISKKLDFLEFKSATKLQKDIPKQHVKLYWDKGTKTNNEDYFDILNNNTYTLEQILVAYRMLIIVCEKWLSDNSFSKRGLNI